MCWFLYGTLNLSFVSWLYIHVVIVFYIHAIIVCVLYTQFILVYMLYKHTYACTITLCIHIIIYIHVSYICMCVVCVVNYVCVAFVCVLYMYSFKYVVRIFTCSHYVPSNFKSTGRQHLVYATHVILHIQKRAWPKAGTHFFILNFFIDSL